MPHRQRRANIGVEEERLYRRGDRPMAPKKLTHLSEDVFEPLFQRHPGRCLYHPELECPHTVCRQTNDPEAGGRRSRVEP
jgi:hypothetical protein